MFKKLDIENHVASLLKLFAREKEVMMEGDVHLHYKFIKELDNHQFNAPRPVKALDSQLMHLKKEGVLKLDDIFEFIKIIRYFEYLKQYQFRPEGVIYKWISELTFPDQVTPYLKYFNDKGELNPAVNQELGSVVGALKVKKKAISARLYQFVNNQKIAPYLVDRQLHLVEGQETLLVRGGFNHMMKASIVGRTAAGFFYIVPREIDKLKDEVEHLNSRVSEITYEIEKEISGVFHKQQGFLKFINRAYDRFDHYQARVFFARNGNFEMIMADKSDKIVMNNFCHPALHNPKPVSVDFSAKTMLITGVNAGGKTMLLKSIMAAAVMAKYLIPMKINKEGTTIGRFKEIMPIIEDPQNVSADISTFAGRIQSFSQLFQKKEVLVGVDEIELGTDSDEASALFKVLIENLMNRGCKIIITTHHKRLAGLLAANRDVDLLAALYDEEKRLPTYSYLQGSIGKSYAFETALRYGIQNNLVREAKTLYGDEQERLGDLITRSTELELELNLKKEKLEKELEDIYEERKKLEMYKDEVKTTLDKEQSRLEREYHEAIKEARAALKANPDTKEMHRKLNIAHKYKKEIAPKEQVVAKDFKVGDYVKYSNTKCKIEKLRNKQAILDCDGRRMTVPLTSLKLSSKPQTKPSGVKIGVTKPSQVDLKLDLHGMRAEASLEKLDQFVSDSLLLGVESVLIYHGIGQGKLVRVVREFLDEHPSVVRYEDAPIKMGGYGATVAFF
jgi:DNA mismatch repair protein MutS2